MVFNDEDLDTEVGHGQAGAAAGRAAGGEGVAEPEAVLGRHPIGGVGEVGRPLVRRHHQVGVFRVLGHHVFGTHDAHLRAVIGDIQQPTDKHLVAGNALLLQLVAGHVRAQLFAHEPALGTDRHDHRVLHLLRLDQAQHLGAEVLQPVRPAQAAGHDLNYIADTGLLSLSFGNAAKTVVPPALVADIGGGTMPSAPSTAAV